MIFKRFRVVTEQKKDELKRVARRPYLNVGFVYQGWQVAEWNKLVMLSSWEEWEFSNCDVDDPLIKDLR